MKLGMPRFAALLAASLLVSAPAVANTLADPAGDFLPSFAGPLNGDLDIISVTATYDGTNVYLSSTQNAAIGTTTGAVYVWGVDRGAGTARLASGTPPLGTGVLFDGVIQLRANGTGQVTTFPEVGSPTTTPLASAAITISGNGISGIIPLSLLPSRGFSVAQYAYNLWPRSPGTGNTFIPDFAPDNSSFVASVVPEPASWALFIAGFGLVGATLRRRALLSA